MMWNLLAPSPEYNNRWDAFRDYWYRQTLARQRQLYWYFREEKKAGRSINPNPLFALPVTPAAAGAAKGKPSKSDVPKTYLYDLVTEPGKEYVLK